MKSIAAKLCLLLFFLSPCAVLPQSQIPDGVYLHTNKANGNTINKEMKISAGYLVLTEYGSSPAQFVKTVGGFYEPGMDALVVQLEFNSNYEQDHLRKLSFPFSIEGNKLTLAGDTYEKLPESTQALDGNWLFASRGPDAGQERRGDDNPRKTLKILVDGHFQWIAYHTESFDFSGTGGGTYTADGGKYVENIAYFSRDNGRVGATLEFQYKIQGDDWLHSGNNSKGEPLSEIWARRD